eukprot:6143796-Prymnesium_polylepis.1
MGGVQQCCRPSGRFEQPIPPHAPHATAQQTLPFLIPNAHRCMCAHDKDDLASTRSHAALRDERAECLLCRDSFERAGTFPLGSAV